MKLLADKTAVITGAAQGIGQATALLFARHGASLICIDQKSMDQTLAQLRAEHFDATCYLADVSQSAEVIAIVHECEKSFSKVDVLFNNAGSVKPQTFEETTEDTWSEMVGVNMSSAFLCAKYFLPLMKKSVAGAIIHHGSVDGTLGNASIAAYSAAKGGLLPLTHVMAHDLGKYKIRVNCISSGGIVTQRNEKAVGSGVAGQSRIAVTPLKRRGTAEEVAYVALFLAADWSSYVNGANIVVDGGRTGITPGTFHGYD